MKEGPDPGSASAPEAGDARGGGYRRVLLVGLMGSGKTTVGTRLGELLGWEFLDFDDAVEEAAGRTIPEIFREDGEASFREMEARVGAELLERSRVVLASGGGWPAAPGRMVDLAPDTLSVWLRVSPEEAVRRIRAGDVVRPLLEDVDPVTRARELLAVRRGRYAEARLTLDTEAGSAEDLARTIAETIHSSARSRERSR